MLALVKIVVPHLEFKLNTHSTYRVDLNFILLQMWGIEGFMDHVTSIEAFYQRRRDIMLEAAHKHLTGLADFAVPDGGMFL